MEPSGWRSSTRQPKPEGEPSRAACSSATKLEGVATSTDFQRRPLRQSLLSTRCVVPPGSVHSLSTCGGFRV